MKKSNLPKTDSVQKLAEFWDTHDLTDFEDQLEETPKPVFVRDTRERKKILDLDAAYKQMSEDAAREAEAREWVEGA